MTTPVRRYRMVPYQRTAAALALENAIPLQGERVRETDTGREKVGDGLHHYNDLDYEITRAEASVPGVTVLTGTPAEAKSALKAATEVTRSLTDFGAVADGTYDPVTHAMTGTDNTAAINAALSSGAPVAVPPGMFRFTGVLHTNVDGAGLIGSGSGASFLISNAARNRHLCVEAGTQDTTWTGFTMIGPHVYNGTAEGRALVIGTTGSGTGTTSTPWDASGTWIDDFVTRGFVVGLHNSVGNDVRFGRIETYDTGDSRSEPGGYGISNSGSRFVGKTLIAHNTETRGRHALYFTGLANNCHVDYVDAKGFDFAAIRNRATTGGGQGNGFGFARLEDCNTNLGGGDGTVGGVVQFVCANDVAVTGAGGARIGDFIATDCGGIVGVELRYMPNSRCGTIQVNGHSGDWGGASHYGSLIWNSPNTKQPTIIFASGFGAAGLNDATLVPIRVEASPGCFDGRTVAHSGAVFTNTPTYDTTSANGYLGKVETTTTANRVYGTGASGEQRTYDISVSPVAAAIARRTSESNLQADAFIPSVTSTATAAGTTTLTVDSTEVQRFTGSTTQTVVLPTTSVVAGHPFEIVNDSSGVVTVNSSAAALVWAIPAGGRMRVRANQATPTTPSHWSVFLDLTAVATLVGKAISLADNTVTMTAAQLQAAVSDADVVLATATANRVYGTDASGVARTYEISVAGVAAAVPRLTAEANLVADSFLPSQASTATSGGTLALTVDSVQIQRFAGTTTHTVTLPTTSIVAGRPFQFVNDSTGAVTVNSSGGALVATVAAGGRCSVQANQATPTTAAHWTLMFNNVPTP